jgi:hypothetical protein
MAKLTNMAFTKAEIKERHSPKVEACGSYMGDKYPYGLRLDLNNEALKKLGLKSLPKPGKAMTLTAKVRVVASRMSERENGKPDRNLELQIVQLALDSDASSALEALNEGLEDA